MPISTVLGPRTQEQLLTGSYIERLRLSIIQCTSELLDLPAERFEGLAMVLTSALHGVIFDYLANPDEAWFDRWLQSMRDMVINYCENLFDLFINNNWSNIRYYHVLCF